MKTGQKKVSSNEPKTMQHPSKHQNKPFQTTSQSTQVIRDPSRGLRQNKKKSKILTFSSVRTPPANTSTVQKYGPGSNGSGQDMNWVQFCPKQLVSISHATPDLIRPPHNFQLSVFNPKSQIAMHMARKWKRSNKNGFKWTKINAEPFKASTLAISDNFSINKSHLGP